jgi:hypothetical protein
MKRQMAPITCDLNALDEPERNQRGALASRLRGLVHEVMPTDDGFKFRLAEDETDLRDLAKFVALERRCCLFLTFEIEVGGADGSVRISLGGGKGVKQFLATEFDIDQYRQR